MKRTYIYILGLGMLILHSCSKNPNAGTETKEETASNIIVLSKDQLSNISISQIGLVEKNIGSIIKANGIIDVPPESMISISAPMGGYLKFTKLLPGLKVSKGQLLAIIEDQQFIQLSEEYLSSKNRLELEKFEFQKQKELYAEKAISEKAYLESKSKYELANIQLKSLSEKLKLIGIDPKTLTPDNISSKININSPIDGYVSKVNVNTGKYLSPNDILFELINPDDIHLNIQIYQKDIPYLSVGQKVITYTNDHPEIKHKADIILIGRGLNESKAVDVHCHFDHPEHNLLPGMFMNVEIESSLKKTTVVEESAVLQFENNNYLVLAQNDSTFELYPVKTGIKEKPYIEIINPSQHLTKSKIVNEGAYKILMAMKNKAEE